MSNWTLATAWNKGFTKWTEEENKKNPVPRDYLWASELGNSDIDLYLKLTGMPPSNRPDERSQRKFEAGEKTESVVADVLNRMGILKTQQEHVEFQYDGLLKVTGKIDFMAGGYIDIDKARKTIYEEYAYLSERMKYIFMSTVEELAEQNPKGLDEIPLEIKSSSLYMFDVYSRIGAGDNHQVQLFHYLKAKNIQEGHIVYICRDDYRLAQYAVFNPSEVEEVYKAKIEKMTNYIRNKIVPPLEPTIIWDSKLCRFNTNWNVMYSQYLTYLYKYEHQEDYRTQIEPLVRRMNSALIRKMEYKKMTELNVSALNEIQNRGFDVDQLIKEKQQLGMEIEEEVVGDIVE